MDTPRKDPFEEYYHEKEPSKRERGYAWHTAMGLQAVDGIVPSAYLKETAKKNIEGDISIDQAQELIESYYRANPEQDEERTWNGFCRISFSGRRMNCIIVRCISVGHSR